MATVVVIAGLISLWFTVTNLLPLSLGFLALAPLLPFLFVIYSRQHRVVVTVSLMLGYCLVSVLIYYPGSLIAYSFYRYDGNLFATYAPILVIGMIPARFDLDKS